MDAQRSWLIKAGLHSTFSALGTMYLFGSAQFNLPFANTPAPLWVLGAGAGLVSSLASDYIHEFVKEEIPLKEKAQDEASLLIGAGVSAGSFLLALHLVDRRMIHDYGMVSALAVSVGAELGASFLVNAL